MDTVLLEVKGAVAFITLNRPEKINSFNREMSLSLQEKLKICENDKNVRALHITGAGKGFSAGQDLAEAAGLDGRGLQKILAEHYNPIVAKIRQIEKPVLAAVNGIAAGAGANIALCCDIVVAASSANFIQAFSRIGLIPDSGGTFILPRLVGWQKATALMMLGERVSADEAERIGMIYKVFPDNVFSETSVKIAEMLSLMPTRALALTKQALNRSAGNDFFSHLQVEDELQLQAGSTADFSEGIKAFIEKRNPVFRGE